MAVESDNRDGDSGHFCSICYKPVSDRADTLLYHVQQEHYDNDEFQNFIHSVVIRQHCRKCGTMFWSDVDVLSETTFAARPYCQECRAESRALKNLLTDHMDARELVSRGLYRPEVAVDARSVDADGR